MDSGLELYYGTVQQGSSRGRETADMEKEVQTDVAPCSLQLARREQ